MGGNTYRVTPRIKLLSATLCTIVKILYQIFLTFAFDLETFSHPYELLSLAGQLSFAIIRSLILFAISCTIFLLSFG